MPSNAAWLRSRVPKPAQAVGTLRPAHAAATAKRTARELDRETTDGGLDAYKKPELVELAASIGIENRTNMTKAELVDAISTATRRRTSQGANS
jgi:hypothetical protein